MTSIEGKYQHYKNEDIDDYFSAVGLYININFCTILSTHKYFMPEICFKYAILYSESPFLYLKLSQSKYTYSMNLLLLQVFHIWGVK